MTSPNLKNGDGDGRENIFVVDFGDFVSARRRSHSEAVCWGVGACGSSVFILPLCSAGSMRVEPWEVHVPGVVHTFCGDDA